MAEFKVSCMANVNADTPEQAARQFQAALRDPDCPINVYTVVGVSEYGAWEVRVGEVTSLVRRVR